jgi:short-subunit dehydrogenase
MDAYKAKAVAVTGGTSGIGRELVRQLAAAGAIVYFCGRDSKRGGDYMAELRAAGYNATFCQCDVTDAAQVEAFIHVVLEHEARIDYLFHSAGIIMGGEIRDHKLQDIQKVLETNVLGTAYVSQYVYRIMAEQGFGHIINLASAAGLFPVPLMGVYGASKFYVYGLTEAMRLEGKGLGVRVTTVAPGIVDTPIYDSGIYSHTDKERAKTIIKNKASSITAERAAQKILHGTLKNRTILFTQSYARLTWMIYRYVPYLYRFFAARTMRPYRKRLRKT